MTAEAAAFGHNLPLVLVGLPGTGKSRLGAALGRKFQATHIDTDDLVVARTGKTIAEIFTEDGEASFRERELQAVQDALQRADVVSIGGGGVETPQVRELLTGVTVVWIDADLEVLLKRVRRNRKRPLLQDDPEKRLAELARRREPLYRAVADIKVTSSEDPVENVVNQVLQALPNPLVPAVRSVEVHANPTYPVYIGKNANRAALDQLPADVTKALLVVAPPLLSKAEALSGQLASRGIATTVFPTPEGESSKTLATAEQLWDVAGQMHLGRKDVVITIGGGATTDLGGFIAATWLRGVRLLHLPTTLLAMVDAAVGGKTGINSPAGKNLIGSFYNPIAVGAQTELLKTLPEREYRAGLAEVIKCGFIADPKILDLVEANPEVKDVSWATGEGAAVLFELIYRSVKVKAEVVAEDFREGGRREILNYGHTLAHAIEKLSDYRVRHGEAVAIGMVFAAELATLLGLADPAFVTRHRDVLRAVGLPVDRDEAMAEYLPLMYSDKKTRGDQLRFVLVSEPGECASYEVDAEQVTRAGEVLGEAGSGSNA